MFTSEQKSKQQNLFRKNIEEYSDHKAQYVFFPHQPVEKGGKFMLFFLGKKELTQFMRRSEQINLKILQSFRSV